MARKTSGELAHRIYRTLKDRLLDGEFQPGKRMRMSELTEDFQTSKQPVTEALRMLATDGLVEIVPRVGCKPVSISPDETIDFFKVFAFFEASLTALAAERRTPEQLAELRVLLDQESKIDEQSNPDKRSAEYRRMNRDVHRLIHQMAASPLVSSQSARMWDLSDYLINVSENRSEYREKIDARHTDHERIWLALKSSNVDEARQAMYEHIADVARVLGLS